MALVRSSLLPAVLMTLPTRDGWLEPWADEDKTRVLGGRESWRTELDRRWCSEMPRLNAGVLVERALASSGLGEWPPISVSELRRRWCPGAVWARFSSTCACSIDSGKVSLIWLVIISSPGVCRWSPGWWECTSSVKAVGPVADVRAAAEL